MNRNLEEVLRRLGKSADGGPPTPGHHSYLTQHGIEALVGSDIARISIPAASQLNATLLDAAAGHIMTFGALPYEYVVVTNGVILSSGSWKYESGVTQGSALRLDPNGSMLFFTVGPNDPNNGNNWHLRWSIDSGGNMTIGGAFSPANLAVQTLSVAGKPIGGGQFWTIPGYVVLGPITLQWGTNVLSTPAAPAQTALFIGYMVSVNATMAVLANPMTTDDSLVWFATNNYGQTGFNIDCFRTNLLGGTPGPLGVQFVWLSVGTTP